MRDFTREQLEEASRPTENLLNLIDFCLERLYADRVHSTEDLIVSRLTFEELLGALLSAHDLVESAQGAEIEA